MIIRDAIQSDIEWVRLNPLEDAVKNYPKLTLDGFAKTAIVEDVIMGVGGVYVFWPGMAEAWIILRKEAADYKYQMMKAITTIINEAFYELELNRLEVNIRTDFPKAVEMVLSLGFVCDCKRKKFFPDGTDGLLFSRII